MAVKGWIVWLFLFGLAFIGTAQAGWNPLAGDKQDKGDELPAKARTTIESFKQSDPSLKPFFEKATGYAVFPTVGKGGFGIGGAYGKGMVYRAHRPIGRASLTQLTIGLQLGGQAYSEVIFFGNEAALKAFISGSYELGAQASAVAVTAGASADADYSDGVAVFTMAKGGLMYEASVGGQRFSFSKE